jgi:hypothetical protein
MANDVIAASVSYESGFLSLDLLSVSRTQQLGSDMSSSYAVGLLD